ncbi:MAG: hypothetical protein ACRDHF_00425 [Tepidiformaceae bacterium]
MDFVTLLFAFVLPVGGIAGAWAAWRHQKRGDEAEVEARKWRDDSLDDWRRERDEQVETEREARVERAELEPASTEEREEARRQQRIGG